MITRRIQAIEEGDRDVTTTSVTRTSNQQSEIRKNNFTTYASQVRAIYDGYNAKNDYGFSIIRTIIDTIAALIAGEGISYTAEDPAISDWIRRFVNCNNLNGSRLFSLVTGGAMEGKALPVLEYDAKKKMPKVREMSWHINGYTVIPNDQDNDVIDRVEYNLDDGTTKTILPEKFVYVRLGGSPDRIEETVPRIANALTFIENYDRALFDLRAANHLFSKPTPFWETQTQEQAKAINNAVNGRQWELGKGYAGPAKFSIQGPPTGGAENIKTELSLLLKQISTVVGIPVHWLGWVDLMSNRSTAEELREMLALAVKKERLIWKEALTALIVKAMEMYRNAGNNDVPFDPDGFTIELPFMTLEAVKALQEVWLPLMDAGIISRADMQNRIPGIDPEETNRQIEEEEKGKKQDFTGNIDNIVNARLDEHKNSPDLSMNQQKKNQNRGGREYS